MDASGSMHASGPEPSICTGDKFTVSPAPFSVFFTGRGTAGAVATVAKGVAESALDSGPDTCERIFFALVQSLATCSFPLFVLLCFSSTNPGMEGSSEALRSSCCAACALIFMFTSPLIVPRFGMLRVCKWLPEACRRGPAGLSFIKFPLPSECRDEELGPFKFVLLCFKIPLPSECRNVELSPSFIIFLSFFLSDSARQDSFLIGFLVTGLIIDVNAFAFSGGTCACR